MNQKELVNLVAENTGEPRKTVLAITSALMNIISDSIETSTTIKTDKLVFRAVTTKARPASDGDSEKPEKKVMKVSVRSKQQVVD